MHKLARQVCFTVNPFFPPDSEKLPLSSQTFAEESLSIFLRLGVELSGEVDPATGLIVNVTAIDEKVHRYVVPLFSKRISENFRQGRNTDIPEIIGLLKSARQVLSDKFEAAGLTKLTLAMTPFKKISLDCEDTQMIYFSEKFEFAATHKLWNDSFPSQRNFEIFGKCANPSGHGHNYTVEVTVKIPSDRNKFRLGEFSQTVENNFVKLVDHKNLNIDVAQFAKSIPTVENIAAFAWGKLAGEFGEAKLHCVTIWETDKTCCSFYG